MSPYYRVIPIYLLAYYSRYSNTVAYKSFEHSLFLEPWITGVRCHAQSTQIINIRQYCWITIIPILKFYFTKYDPVFTRISINSELENHYYRDNK